MIWFHIGVQSTAWKMLLWVGEVLVGEGGRERGRRSFLFVQVVNSFFVYRFMMMVWSRYSVSKGKR